MSSKGKEIARLKNKYGNPPVQVGPRSLRSLSLPPPYLDLVTAEWSPPSQHRHGHAVDVGQLAQQTFLDVDSESLQDGTTV